MSTIICLASAVVVMACEPPATVVEAEPKPTYHYSPFIVQVGDSSLQFGSISFKDVGLRRASTAPNDPWLEAIAQSVSYQLELEPSLGVSQTLVDYDATLLDPTNHTACAERHLYVDVWNGEDRWGYSLWSGCSETDNFAWAEVPIAQPDADITEKVDALGDAIASSLADAHVSGCFQKVCTCAEGTC